MYVALIGCVPGPLPFNNQQVWQCEIGHHGRAVYTVMPHGRGYGYTRRTLLSMHTVIKIGILQQT